MSTKRTARTTVITGIRRKLGALELIWAPGTGDPLAASAASATHAASTALAVSVALLRALRDRGLLSAGEIDDLFGEAAEHLRDASALKLLNRVRDAVEYKEEE
jgi:hypothetical protein